MANAAASQTKTPAKSKANGAASEPSVEDLQAVIQTLRADISRLAETVRGLGAVKAQDAAKSAREKGKALKAAGEEHFNDVRAQAEAFGQDAGDYVRKNPLTALSVAVGLGFLIGSLSRSRS